MCSPLGNYSYIYRSKSTSAHLWVITVTYIAQKSTCAHLWVITVTFTYSSKKHKCSPLGNYSYIALKITCAQLQLYNTFDGHDIKMHTL